MKKRASQALIISVLIILPVFIIPAFAKTQEITLESLRANTSTETVIGVPVSIKAAWFNTSYGKIIYTFVDFSVDVYEKSTLATASTIQVVYEGGTIGEISCVAIRNPWRALWVPKPGRPSGNPSIWIRTR